MPDRALCDRHDWEVVRLMPIEKVHPVTGWPLGELEVIEQTRCTVCDMPGMRAARGAVGSTAAAALKAYRLASPGGA